jgi:hypothetical protein
MKPEAFGAIERAIDWGENLYDASDFAEYQDTMEAARAELSAARKLVEAAEDWNEHLKRGGDAIGRERRLREAIRAIRRHGR